MPGKVVGWQIGTFEKKSGRSVYGLKLEYQQSRKRYVRKAYKAKRGRISHEVPETKAAETTQSFTKIIEVPEIAKNIRLREGLPKECAPARQNVR
ncbi:MAG: hypothetical protein EOR25_30050 [Mesorhizobium sp.]|uniref:hypothetical protein n=1 Tax=Mesorhizobium sp. TaxID=1871066 RepID=UPI000FE2BCA5|nr:hypothetical protein [Mesorhizobium sp.]RWJ04890.1 MAG: hypothetical protein EOR24_29945 [Mesorhizobium sp.]RWJ11946.1 MAG: hypothetical protein EOR25_30050 [Mesorhizobium sp.]